MTKSEKQTPSEEGAAVDQGDRGLGQTGPDSSRAGGCTPSLPEDVYEQVAAAVPCDREKADGQLDGQHVVLVMGEPKPGEIALYRMVARQDAVKDAFRGLERETVELAGWFDASHWDASTRHAAEEAECAHKCMDREGVPRADAVGEVFSLWGRIQEFAHQEVQNHIPPNGNDDEWLEREP